MQRTVLSKLAFLCLSYFEHFIHFLN